MTGWYKTYFATKPVMFMALAGQLVAAGALLVFGRGARGGGGVSKRFDPWRTLVAPGRAVIGHHLTGPHARVFE